MKRWLSRRFPTVPRQLGALFVASAVLVVGIVGVSLALVTRLSRVDRVLETTLVPAQVEASSLDRLYRDLEFDARSTSISSDQLAAVAQVAGDMTSTAAELLADDPTLSGDLSSVDAAAAEWIDALAAADADGTAASAAFGTLRAGLTDLETDIAARVDERRRDASTIVDQLQLVLISASIITVAFGALALRTIRRSIATPIRTLVRQIGAIADGELTNPIHPSGPTDLATIATAAESMRQRLLDEVGHRAQSALIAGHLAESERLAGQLHDDQVQAMTLASIRLQRLRRKLSDEPELTSLAAAAEQATNDAIARLRRVIFELHSPVLESEGIVAAIEAYLDETCSDDVAWSVTAGGDVEVAPSTARLLYRLSREALFNAVKHADATSIHVDIDVGPRSVVVVVTDDGVGFDPGSTTLAERGHLGLGHCAELAQAAGGSWTLASAPGRGTSVRISLPTSDC